MYKKELEIAKKAVLIAGGYLKQRTDIQVNFSDERDLKLSSDQQSEATIKEILKETKIPVLAEESGESGNLGELYWIVDPLDGTVNYYKGMTELSCVSVALWKQNEPVLGVVYRFIAGELFYGCVGDGAYLNGQRITVSSVEQTNHAVLATGFPVKRSYETEKLQRFIKSVQCFKKIRMLGAAALMASYVACGRLDAYIEEEIMLWDVAGAAAIVKAAGGSVELELLKDYKCICRCFANEKLREDYYAQGL